MKKRILGKNNLEVSAIELGCRGMSFGYGPAADKKDMISLIHQAVEEVLRSLTRQKFMGPIPTRSLSAKHWPDSKGK